MDDLNHVIGAALGAGAAQLVLGWHMRSWARELHRYLSGLAAHVGYQEPPPPPAMKGIDHG